MQNWEGLHADICRFMVQYQDDQQLTADFMHIFEPDLIDQPWDMSIREFLMRIDQLTKQPTPVEASELRAR